MSASDRSLRTLAANRGFRLVKSRIRTPGRRDFGKYGLVDAQSGKEAFGFSRHRLTATAGEVEEHLRGLAELGWKQSLRRVSRR
jgi:hypothetical protein